MIWKKSTLSEIKKQIDRGRLLCVLVVIAAVMLNVLFTCFRTEANHIFMLVSNILTDTIGGWFVVYFAISYISPRYRFYIIAARPAQKICGTVTGISEHTTRYMKVDCVETVFADRKLFLPVHFLPIEERVEMVFYVVSGVVVEVEYA